MKTILQMFGALAIVAGILLCALAISPALKSRAQDSLDQYTDATYAEIARLKAARGDFSPPLTSQQKSEPLFTPSEAKFAGPTAFFFGLVLFGLAKVLDLLAGAKPKAMLPTARPQPPSS